jgi:hypothetical protein
MIQGELIKVSEFLYKLCIFLDSLGGYFKKKKIKCSIFSIFIKKKK